MKADDELFELLLELNFGDDINIDYYSLYFTFQFLIDYLGKKKLSKNDILFIVYFFSLYIQKNSDDALDVVSNYLKIISNKKININ